MQSQAKRTVYVQGQCLRRPTIQMWLDKGYEIVNNLNLADIVCWTGGDDVHPIMYGESLLPSTYPNITRDHEDVKIYNQAVGKSWLVGLCRGGQLLNVLNKGKLWQDVDGHGSGVHDVFDTLSGTKFQINTLHHQGIIPTEKADILAYSKRSTHKVSEAKEWTVGVDQEADKRELDIEACWYEQTNSLCFQAHPEFPHKPTTEYFFELLNRYVEG